MASDGYRRGYVSFAHFLLYCSCNVTLLLSSYDCNTIKKDVSLMTPEEEIICEFDDIR